MADNFIDGFKKFWGVGTQEDEELFNDDFYDEMKRKDLETEDGVNNMNNMNNMNTMNAIHEASQKSMNTIKTSNKVLNIHSNAQLNVVLYHPKTFEESTGIIDTLKSKRPVVMNIAELDKDLARKIFDFCSGALYALDGHIQQVSRGIFILAPQNVDITGDVTTSRVDSQVNSWLKED